MTDMVYPTDKMRQIAQKMRTNATNAMNMHVTHWNRAQQSISELPGFMQSPLNTVLNPHDQSLRDSYQWQLDFADALERAADEMDGLDKGLTGSF